MGYLLLVLTSLCLLASSTRLHDHKPRLISDSTTSKTDSLKESCLGATSAHEHDISSIGDDSSERSGIVHSSKFAHGSVYEGEHGGGATGAADTSNGGGDDHGSGADDHGSGGDDHGSGADDHRSGGDDHGSGADDHRSGAAVITGAAINHHTSEHHNAGSHHANVMVFPISITTALVALIVH